MNHEISAHWMGKMQFNALVNGHTVVMDAPERVGGEDNGPIPKPLILTALSGCTGMDIVSLLRKNQCEVTNFEIDVRGELSKAHPLQYVAIHLDYLFQGPPEYQDAALQAVTLSQEKYCGVSDMLKKIMPVTWTVVYNGNTIFSNQEGIVEASRN
ncbi:MAG TPA: OsmC family protein [Puia sp.]|nr:OsmC family protein [Puia sp.]